MRQANDVEENSGPTEFEIISPMRTASADYSQANEELFCENSGKQCVHCHFLLLFRLSSHRTYQ